MKTKFNIFAVLLLIGQPAFGQNERLDALGLPPDIVSGEGGATQKSIRILRLNMIEAETLASTLKQLFQNDLAVTAYAKTNILVLVGTQEQLQEAGKLVSTLDRKGPPRTALAAAHSLEEMKLRYTVSEQRTLELAAEYGAESVRLKADHPRLTELHSELQEAVSMAFQARQDLYRAEIVELQRKIQQMKDLIPARERIKSEIIERRVADLKNPNRLWEESPQKPISPPPINPTTNGATVQAVIMAVSEEDQLVEISVGADDGLKLNTRLIVWRGNQRIGEIEVIELHSDKSLARITKGTLTVPLKAGDQVRAEQNTDSHLHNQEPPSDQSSEPGQKPRGKIRDKPLPTEAAFLQIRNADGSRAVFNNVVTMTVGFPKTSPAIWMGSPSRDGIVSLEGLPAGAHWLLAAGDSPGRLPFKVTIPTKQALLQQRLRSPEWWGKKVEFGRQPMVEVDAKVGEVIVVEIHNQSTAALRFSEADIVLVSQLEDELIRGLSPHWLTADREPFPETRVEAGQTGRLRLIWRDWARQGLWSSRNHETIAEPGFPPNEPGKVWVKAGLGFAGSLPVSVTDPKLIPAKPEPQPAAVDPLENTPPRGVPKGNSEEVVIRVVGRIVDADSGEPINNVAWQYAQVDKSSQKVNWEPNFRLAHPLKDGKFDEMLPAGSNYQRRMIAAGYEPAALLDEVPNPLPDPPVVERTIRLKKGRIITGVLRDHLGKPAAGAQMFFIPQGADAEKDPR